MALLPIGDDLQRLTDGKPLTSERMVNQDSGLCECERWCFFFPLGAAATGNDAPKTSSSFDDAHHAKSGLHNDPFPVPFCLLPARSRPASAARSSVPVSCVDPWPVRYSRST